MVQVRSLELLLTTPIEADAIPRINQYLLRESLYIENPEYVTLFMLTWGLNNLTTPPCTQTRTFLLLLRIYQRPGDCPKGGLRTLYEARMLVCSSPCRALRQLGRC